MVKEAPFDAWITHLYHDRGLSEHTIRVYGGDFVSYLGFLGSNEGTNANELVQILTTHKIYLWLDSSVQEGASCPTPSYKTASLRAFTSWARERGILPSDPTLVFATARTEQRLPRVLNRSDTERLMEHACLRVGDEGGVALRDWAILGAIYAMGICVSKLCRLGLTSPEWASAALRVVGKGNRERVIPLTPIALVAIERWLE